jgi:DNA repair photolyase
MQKISDRIKDVNRLKDLGWEVHINYSPVIFYPGWEELYDDLFNEVKLIAGENKCEVIALTNHALQMSRSNELAQKLMRFSSEIKNNEKIMRYPLSYKTKWLNTFKYLYSQYFDLNTIRYIF